MSWQNNVKVVALRELKSSDLLSPYDFTQKQRNLKPEPYSHYASGQLLVVF